MKHDVRDTDLYREAEALYETLRRPGTGQVSYAAEIHASPDERHAVFTGTIEDRLEGAPSSRICEVDLASGNLRVLTAGPNNDRLPKYSPSGARIAFLSDREKAGDFQLYLLDATSGAVRLASRVDGWVETLHWSLDGKRILLGVADHGADVSGGQGAVTSRAVQTDQPAWLPTVQTGEESHGGRSAWVYDVAADRAGRVSKAGTNIWEAAWCGNGALAAVVSAGPNEGLWYSASLCLIDVATGQSRELYRPKDQLGWAAASPSGQYLAVVEAVCSDRGIVAGDLLLIEVSSGQIERVEAFDIQVSMLEWRNDDTLLFAGMRGFETVVALFGRASAKVREVWVSRELSTGGREMAVSGLGESGDCVLLGENFSRAPELAVIRQGRYRSVKAFDMAPGSAEVISSVEGVTWKASDGLEIQGWLLRPRGTAPFPLIMFVHGGPVSHWRPMWLGRPRGVPILLLLRRGYAIFLPNPRGSSGRSQDFARKVVGDLGGADTHDLLSGLDDLVRRGVADPEKLGVIGTSYGGFMTAWLITQDARFVAAVAVAPISNHVTEHLISNIPHFVKLFLDDTYTNPAGKYFERSPIMHAYKAKTPTLNICGALDRCTPPEEAMQFHNALLESGVKSVLVTYPEEGHGVRKFPAAIDYAARVVAWFEQHIPTTRATGPLE